ncbi:unnamed protein product [Didymodactylos carnosus]|uniref:Homeobox domain-containing protein n=1 Tax=Didymodactylos carnosus TaxID=1234261 RepID=A0A813TW40_9BILA|nr:unnamed protein product [Didymodactylos carnosus]CAF3599947.1 unnamed protein product [Didymodactylos carnosus]
MVPVYTINNLTFLYDDDVTSSDLLTPTNLMIESLQEQVCLSSVVINNKLNTIDLTFLLSNFTIVTNSSTRRRRANTPKKGVANGRIGACPSSLPPPCITQPQRKRRALSSTANTTGQSCILFCTRKQIQQIQALFDSNFTIYVTTQYRENCSVTATKNQIRPMTLVNYDRVIQKVYDVNDERLDYTISTMQMTNRTIQFLIPPVTLGEPSHILTLPSTFANEEDPLNIPLPYGKCILAPIHYYDSVQPLMNTVMPIDSDFEKLSSYSFLNMVKNLAEYSISCPIFNGNIVDMSNSAVNIDDTCSLKDDSDFDDLNENSIDRQRYCSECPSDLNISEWEYQSDMYDSCHREFLPKKQDEIFNDDQLMPAQNSTSYSAYTNSELDASGGASATGTSCDYGSDLSGNLNYLSEIQSDGSNVVLDKNNQKRIENKNIRNSRKRTKFTATDLDLLNIAFGNNPMPTRADITILSEKLNYPRYVIQVWYYNKRQSLKRTCLSSSSRLSVQSDCSDISCYMKQKDSRDGRHRENRYAQKHLNYMNEINNKYFDTTTSEQEMYSLSNENMMINDKLWFNNNMMLQDYHLE